MVCQSFSESKQWKKMIQTETETATARQHKNVKGETWLYATSISEKKETQQSYDDYKHPKEGSCFCFFLFSIKK